MRLVPGTGGFRVWISRQRGYRVPAVGETLGQEAAEMAFTTGNDDAEGLCDC
jgi:hypothetical protein